MKTIRTYVLLLSITFGMNLMTVHAQEQKILTYEQYLSVVRSEHPLSKTAQLVLEQGEANIRANRGAFDPQLYQKFENKNFDGTEYYSLSNFGLKVPTWYGIDIAGGLEQNSGTYLNPENLVPDDGLFYAGVNVPIGQGLFIDKRRAELRKAQIFFDMSEMQRQILLNNLLLEAGNAYWNWFMAYNNFLVFEDALELVQVRYDAVIQGAALGDRPNMDTVEAGIQLQNREIMYRDAELRYQNATVLLSVYLWQNGFVPVEVDENTIPEALDNDMTSENPQVLGMDSLINNHPELNRARLKIDQLDIDRRWKREQLKPTLNLKYNFLSENVNNFSEQQANFNDRTWGVEFKMPIFLRQERGELRMAKLKLQQANLELKPKQAMLQFKAQAAANEWQTTLDQIQVGARVVEDYSRLLQGERELFNAGESSLFLVNQREMGYISAQVKLVELVSKNQKAILKTQFALGSLSRD